MRYLYRAGLLVLLTGCSGQAVTNPQAPPGHAMVVAVADGDTITVRIAGRTEIVRLIGLDTPEVGHHDTQVECFGPEASQATKQLLPVGTTVRLTRGPEARDVYNRLLAYVWRTDDNLLVNLHLVTNGYADTLNIAPNITHADAFHAAAQQARNRGLGLWSACATGSPP